MPNIVLIYMKILIFEYFKVTNVSFEWNLMSPIRVGLFFIDLHVFISEPIIIEVFYNSLFSLKFSYLYHVDNISESLNY